MCVAAAVAGGAIVGGVASGAMSSSASKSAASTQANAANYAADLQQQQYEQTRADLSPYQNLGFNAIGGLNAAINNPALQQNFNYGDFSFGGFDYAPYQAPSAFTAPTAAEAQQTPGYQFTLDNGLKAAQNSASARGLGSSGAALKAASTYATGLADSTYNDVFNRDLQAYNTNTTNGLNTYNTNYNNALQSYQTNLNAGLSKYNTNRNNALQSYQTNYGIANDAVNRMLGLVNIGQNSAALTASAGQQSANSIANTVTSGAAAQAAGTVGAANGISNGISTAVNGGTNALLLNSLSSRQGSTLYGATDAYGNPV